MFSNKKYSDKLIPLFGETIIYVSLFSELFCVNVNMELNLNKKTVQYIWAVCIESNL